MPNVVVFDVIETLLDLKALDPYFVRVFGDAGAREQWFGRVLKTALTSTITGPYRDFGKIGAAALDMTAALRGMQVGSEDKEQLREALANVPAHPDVVGGLGALREAGFRLATLSNNPRESSAAQLQNANLMDFFDFVLSADDAQRLKPAPEPYRYAAQQLGVDVAEMWMVAAHSWDIEGAHRAGWRTAFVERSGHVMNPLADSPTVTGPDLESVSAAILRQVH
ncbi:haloacid dehalogenase type II [Deinococcus sp. SM5_A1]|uniref:haloacid dehalogenase type II n=1 Tax=Deinococcus sp. SM5_A1 TaxID=3379094 RepID=UPI00385DD858